MKLLKPLIFIAFAVILLTACTAPLSSNSWPEAALNQEVIYLANATGVYSLRLSDGGMNWRYPEKADNARVFFATPTLANDQLIVGDFTNTLYSLDAKTGAEKWKFQGTGRWIAGALVVGDTILAPSADSHLYALDLQGKLKWQFKTKQGNWATPASDGENVYLASMDHFLYAVSLANGNKVWSIDMSGSMIAGPVLDKEGILYIGTLANEVIAIESKSGNSLWKYKTSGGVWSKLVLKENVLYFGDADSKVYALATQDGSEKWKTDASAMITGSPGLIPDGLVFGTESGDVYAISFSGEKLWPRKFNGKLYSDVLVSGERILLPVTQGDKLLVSMDLKGNEVWSFVPPK